MSLVKIVVIKYHNHSHDLLMNYTTCGDLWVLTAKVQYYPILGYSIVRNLGEEAADSNSSRRKQKMAEREGFEPSVRLTSYPRLAGGCLRPLGHLSAFLN